MSIDNEELGKILVLLKTGRDLIEEAMDTHIYHAANCEKSDADCGYAKHIKDVDKLIAELWDGKTDSDDNPCIFRSHYLCESCDEEWESEWSCDCNDKCSTCNREIESYQCEEFNFSTGRWE
jgi:hypothetical protein